jgi:hypothetical protein
MNKQGEWCTVKFKYEKLGTFCFVCGVMGHAENKCPVRFAMEEDNGIREWSSELRADSRRQGGKFVSRWLREEKGNSDGIGSNSTVAPPEPPVNNLNMGASRADVEPATNPALTNLSNPRQTALITRQQQSLANNTTLIPMPTQPNNINVSANDFQLHPSFQSLLARFSTEPTQAIITPDNLKLSAPHPNIPPVTHNNSHITLTQSETTVNQTQLLPNQTFVFNSQPNLNAMSATPTAPPNHTHRNPPLTIQHRTKTNTDPNLTRPTQPKKIKNNPPRSNPTHNPHEPEKTHDEHNDMELQCDKKRRRDENSSSTTNYSISQSFLTAGPGRQDCRDQ